MIENSICDNTIQDKNTIITWSNMDILLSTDCEERCAGHQGEFELFLHKTKKSSSMEKDEGQ